MHNIATVSGAAENGLITNVIDSIVKTIKNLRIEDYNDLQQIINEYLDVPGYVLAYLDYKVLIGQWEHNQFLFYSNERFEIKYLQKLRVFNIKGEVYLWKTDHQIYSLRFRIDEQRDGSRKVNIVDAEQIIWGKPLEKSQIADGWSELVETRGIRLIVPLDLSNTKTNGEMNRLKLHTRSYVGYLQNYQAGYVDCRMIGFRIGGEPLEES